jgi:hypothetical protein
MLAIDPVWVTLAKREVPREMKGKRASKTKENFQPLKKAKKMPEKHMKMDSTMVPIFSPSALWIAIVSLASFELSSEGLIESYHEISCCKMALR